MASGMFTLKSDDGKGIVLKASTHSKADIGLAAPSSSYIGVPTTLARSAPCCICGQVDEATSSSPIFIGATPSKTFLTFYFNRDSPPSEQREYRFCTDCAEVIILTVIDMFKARKP